ncbi:MAG: hypothetical protein CO094_01480 [Anaerolineae bacterium CG_4_9_14_3_um_filter_57_17]|nr:hypothetical protein [bacterium]NCT19590.1 hypothetical protein [bacterium]OIO85429.1 MAG: hypothetical protein AUK01_06150 [Anaerolineae bacterium CG2_30_57_67]PJB68316.1 MAG: hypothetical protein CO094_01480 [Anaerolineae bacterium CG_4_9_14_3_um_filter_57_17]
MSEKYEPDELFADSAPLTPDDERLEKLFDELETGSLKTLEDAARQIITLATTLLGAFFGLLALKDSPAYLQFFEVKIIGALTLCAFLTALLFALQAVTPRRYDFPRASLSAKRQLLAALLTRKRQAVQQAAWIFGFGAFLLLLAALDILFLRL